MNLLEVILWGELVGVLAWDEVKQTTSFEYAKDFRKLGLELTPLIAPSSSKIIKAHVRQEEIGDLEFDVSKGLPLFISDSLPDKFGTDLFSKYLEREGRSYRDLNPLEKLAYIGTRGMGALEFQPAKHDQLHRQELDLNRLNRLSKSLISGEPIGKLEDLGNLFHVGTSPGGAQPKVLINIDPETGNVYRGDNLPTPTQESWILKFNRDTGSPFDKERGKIEYAYFLMARSAKIRMMESALKLVGDEHCFMTKRFDRVGGEKVHTQTLHAFAGMNFKLPNTYSYEQVFSVFNRINLDYQAREQLFRVMVFNAIGRNVDDHTKNFGFNMDKSGVWQKSPAYDLTFSYNDNYGRETPHFLSINGKNEGFSLDDILAIAKEFSIKSPKRIINEVNQSLLQWQSIASDLKISKKAIDWVAEKMNTIPYRLGTRRKR